MNDTDFDNRFSKRSAVHRSPSYPAIDLKAAIERARVFYQHEKRSAANVQVAAQHWGYSFSSSGGKQVLAALIAYGLMEDKGSGEQRQVALTDLAFRILLDERPDSAERDDAIRRAALLPRIHAELFSKWPDGLPSDPNLRHYLLIEKKFNENAVDDFIRKLRTTADFAKIYTRTSFSSPQASPDENIDVIPSEPSSNWEVSSQGYLAQTPGAVVTSTPAPFAPTAPGQFNAVVPGSFAASTPTSLVAHTNAAQVRQDTFTLDHGQVVLQWPSQLTEENYEDLKDWLELQLRKIRRSVQTSS